MTKRVGTLERESRSQEEEMIFAEESAMAQAAIAVANALAASGITQRELAARLGRAESWISQILSADSNPTVKSMARIGWAVGLRVTVQFLAPAAACAKHEPYPGRAKSGRWIMPEEAIGETVEAANTNGLWAA